MSATRRIVVHVFHTSLAAKDPRHACNRKIVLDRKTYRCGREVRRFDGQHDGIHDAFTVHGDHGMVRW